MIHTDNQTVFNFGNAVWGMRNPMASWDQADSRCHIENEEIDDDSLIEIRNRWMNFNGYGDSFDCETEAQQAQWMAEADRIEEWLWDNSKLEQDGIYISHFYFGPKDMRLAQNLIRAGSDESKFMRQIGVSVDITAPLYWWKEMDTYKVGTTANSTSTMHKLTSKPIEYKDFSFDVLDFINEKDDLNTCIKKLKDEMQLSIIIETCELLRQNYLETRDEAYWRALIQILPESYNQTRTWTANYAVLRNIYFARRNHKLQEWRDFCKWIETLPYAKELICLEEKKDK